MSDAAAAGIAAPDPARDGRDTTERKTTLAEAGLVPGRKS
jgi:hypothetical protein